MTSAKGLSLPALDIDLPDFSGIDFELPSVTLPTIPVPSMDLPDISFLTSCECCTCTALGGLVFAFAVELISDFKDLVLIFGKSRVLMRKAIARKQRLRAREYLAEQTKAAKAALAGAGAESRARDATVSPTAVEPTKVVQVDW